MLLVVLINYSAIMMEFRRCTFYLEIAFISLLLSEALTEDLRELHVSNWWENAGFYQIYPRSFKDSNGDGIGDLNGITEKLSYLKNIGVKAFWLSPIFKSPMVDFGYDIADFVGIQPEYGTMKDFDNLVKEAKRLGLRIILDFVPNHSSDEHEWFGKSVNREAGYEDFYVWNDGVLENDGTRSPPNNWNEDFGGSAWQWSDKRQQFYLHQFHIKQPDLNYRNPAVVEAMKNVLRFWLDKGVDGFRVDAVPWLFEDEQLRDEPLSGLSPDNPQRPEYLNRIYTRDLPEAADMVYQWREVMDDYRKEHGGDTRVLMTEAWSDLPIVATYFNDSNGRLGSQMPFNFQLILHLDKSSKASNFKTVIDSWLNTVPVGHAPNWVIGNHDRRRVASRMGGDHMADIMAMVELSMPGVSVTYQGDELGMVDTEVSWEETKDPNACQSNENVYQQYSRDPERSPFQWDATTHAGFTTASKPWLPVNPNYVTVNVEAELNADKSHLKVFEELMKVRDEDDFHDNKYGTAVLGANTFVIVRVGDSRTYYTLVNLANAHDTVNVADLFTKFGTEKSYDTAIVRVASVSSKRSTKDSVTLSSLQLDPYEALVLQSGANVSKSIITLIVLSLTALYKYR
uniref:alpha-glucosidase n=1 Tax=Culex tarsalis TaxID=7177 RepID=A0A1Q3FRY4_CULTA